MLSPWLLLAGLRVVAFGFLESFCFLVTTAALDIDVSIAALNVSVTAVIQSDAVGKRRPLVGDAFFLWPFRSVRCWGLYAVSTIIMSVSYVERCYDERGIVIVTVRSRVRPQPIWAVSMAVASSTAQLELLWLLSILFGFSALLSFPLPSVCTRLWLLLTISLFSFFLVCSTTTTTTTTNSSLVLRSHSNSEKPGTDGWWRSKEFSVVPLLLYCWFFQCLCRLLSIAVAVI